MPLYYENKKEQNEQTTELYKSVKKENSVGSFCLILIAISCLFIALYGFLFNNKQEEGSSTKSKTSLIKKVNNESAGEESQILDQTDTQDQSKEDNWQLTLEAIRQRQEQRNKKLGIEVENAEGESTNEFNDILDIVQKPEPFDLKTARKTKQQSDSDDLGDQILKRKYVTSARHVAGLIIDSVGTCSRICEVFIEYWESADDNGNVSPFEFDANSGDIDMDSELDTLDDDMKFIQEQLQKLPFKPSDCIEAHNKLHDLHNTYMQYARIARYPTRYRNSIYSKKDYYENKCNNLYNRLQNLLEVD